MKDEKDLSIILLVWRDVDFLRACLDAIANARGDLEIEIILIQNGVTFDTPCLTYLPLRVIHNDSNLGVARARNQGLGSARARYLMLLDVDTRVTQDSLEKLVCFMDQNLDVGLAGPRLQDGQGNLQYTCRKLPTVASKMLRRIPTRWANDALANEMLAAYDHRTPRAVDYVIGACQIIRRAAFEQIGFLDEQFFYGPEDVDYCIRIWRSGWRVLYVPDAIVMHDEQRLTKQRALSKLSLIHAGGLARYFWKYKYAFTRPQLRGQARGTAPTQIDD